MSFNFHNLNIEVWLGSMVEELLKASFFRWKVLELVCVLSRNRTRRNRYYQRRARKERFGPRDAVFIGKIELLLFFFFLFFELLVGW